jgi:hypothetical protein
MFKRRFSITSKGIMRLGPHNAKVSDLVFIPSSAQVPYVLWKMESERDFRVMGDWSVINPCPNVKALLT